MLNQKTSKMKKLLGLVLILCSLMVISTYSYALDKSSVEHSVYKQDMPFIGVLDAFTPSVSPVYGKPVLVHSLNVNLSKYANVVMPVANSPPNYLYRRSL